MASTFPTSLDTFTNPTASSLLTSPSHSLSHSDLNDAVEALEAKVAIGNTVLGVYQAYTPTFTNLTVGNGTLAAQYCTVNKFVHTFGSLTFGSTTAFTGTAIFSLPVVTVAAEMGASSMAFGFATYVNSASGSVVKGTVNAYGSTTGAILWVATTSGTYEGQANPTATIPHTWATGDIIRWNIMYKAA
jgi:hypothetical protein